jgi:hypothetical protein
LEAGTNEAKICVFIRGWPVDSGQDFIKIDINFKKKFYGPLLDIQFRDIVKFNEKSESEKKNLRKILFGPPSAFF